MNTDLLDLLLKAVGTVTALVAAAAGAVRYFREQERNRILRREELAWRKAEFVFRLAEKFDADEEYRQAIQITDFAKGLPEGSSLERVLGTELLDLTPEERACRFTIDHYLDFFDRLYHLVFVLRVFTTKDIVCFAWYIRRLGHCDLVAQYAHRHGYDDVLKLHEVFAEHYQTPKENGVYPQ